jgi:Antibiotic biosynthesis monooxygenase
MAPAMRRNTAGSGRGPIDLFGGEPAPLTGRSSVQIPVLAFPQFHEAMIRRLLGVASGLPPVIHALPCVLLTKAIESSACRGVWTMFSAIRRYTVKRGTVEELIRRVQEHFVPIVRNMPGFGGYYLVNGGPEVLIAISVFDNADGALASNELAADWVRKNVLDSAAGRPEVIVGDVVISEVK